MRKPLLVRKDRPRSDPATLPREVRPLAAWFAEGVRAELAALEKQANAIVYEVLAGVLLESKGPQEALYRFRLADAPTVPEDSSGRLETPSSVYQATVVRQQNEFIEISLRGNSRLPESIPRGLLSVDDTALLRLLADALDKIATGSSPAGSLVTAVFHPAEAKIGTAVLPTASAAGLDKDREVLSVVERACGSSVTYIWGPPGTGKTYTIARIVAALVESNKRVLVTGHTHSSIDQALYELIKRDGNQSGPLCGHPAVANGGILRVGRCRDNKIPEEVRLDAVAEARATGLKHEISSLLDEAEPLRSHRSRLEALLGEWARLSALEEQLEDVRPQAERAAGLAWESASRVRSLKALLLERNAAARQTEHAWFFRQTRLERATIAIHRAEIDLQRAEEELNVAMASREVAERTKQELASSVDRQQQLCSRLPSAEDLKNEVAALAVSLNPIEARLQVLCDRVNALEKSLIAEAKALFCTLTKNYTSDALEGETVDAVVIDEISMALPPLIFLAANRATQHVILVGDFLQLPPIVRSDSEISNERLRKDLFELAGLARENRLVLGSRVVMKLNHQRRMVTEIASVARQLVYKRAGGGGLRDHPDVASRTLPDWLDVLPTNPLVIVDTVDLNCWTGKQAGGLSRFNFYSATLAVEIAAALAGNIGRPDESAPRPIGIITPYAAQRRLLRKLVDEAGLNPWVAAGTVHTFQGQQAELIIFDTVLDEPYWAARLCTPSMMEGVLRDLNVAVTRARNKFVLVGSSEWLDKHARPTSGLGALWEYLKEHADLISALDVLPNRPFQPPSMDLEKPIGWSNPRSEDGFKIQLLDEQSFFQSLERDLNGASVSIFAFTAYFGQYRWPRVEPSIRAALQRGVEVTIITPPVEEAPNPSYVEKAAENLRKLGASVLIATGMHGKDILIDGRIVYTGSLNWASSRGRVEIVHRIDSPGYAALCLEMIQAKHIRAAGATADGTQRTCPHCGSPTRIVNLRRQPRWDPNPLKIGCSNEDCPEGYLVPVNERAPFAQVPRCSIDGRTKYRRVRRGSGETWKCPKHPRECPTHKVVAGDPA